MTDPLDAAMYELVPPFTDRQPDWANVVERSTRLARQRSFIWQRHPRAAIALALTLVAICLPAIALSASVRGWLGLGSEPVYKKARLVVSTPIAGNRVARLWVSPSTDGGACVITTVTPASLAMIDPMTGALRPSVAKRRDSGGYGCSVGSTHVSRAFTWTFSPVAVGNPHAALIDGHVDQSHKAAHVEVVWNGGKQELRTVDGYFIGVVMAIRNPAFSRLPYTIVGYNQRGHAVARRRIPTSFLFTNWKDIEGRIHQYRQKHGCSTKPSRLWSCKSR